MRTRERERGGEELEEGRKKKRERCCRLCEGRWGVECIYRRIEGLFYFYFFSLPPIPRRILGLV